MTFLYSPSVNIVALIAGTNDPSNSATLAEAFLDGMREAVPDSAITPLHLKDLQIEHFRLECYGPDCPAEPDFRQARDLLQNADGFVIASPVWNFGVPAHLKNFIDRCGSFGLDAATRTKGTFNGKPFYLIYTGGAPAPAWTGLMNRTTSFVQEGWKYFGATHIGTHYEQRCTRGKGVFGLVVDQRPDSLANVHRQGQRFAEIVLQYKQTGKLPTRHSLLRAFYEAGRKMMSWI